MKKKIKATKATKAAEREVLIVPVADIVPRWGSRDENPNRMEPEMFAQLVEMIRHEGDLQPVLVVRRPDGKYGLIDGHHRRDAVIAAGRKTIWAMVVAYDDARALAVSFGLNRYKGELDLSTSALLLSTIEADFGRDELGVLTGFSAEELDALLDVGDDALTDDDVMNEAAGASTDTEERPEKPFVLEITFASKDEYQLARKKLRKAGGGDLGHGLLVVLGEAD